MSQSNGPNIEEAILFQGEERRSLWDRIVTPRVVLLIFTALNFIIYYDRGAVSGCLNVIKADAAITGNANTLTDTQLGFLYSGFMIGFMTSCPLFAAFGGVVQSKWVILAGMIAWGVSCVGTALAKSYWFLMLSRVMVGIGEAAFAGFTVTVIDRIAPQNSRTLWIGTFYSMIPVGTAVGMALGGIISAKGMIGSIAGWRIVFLTEVVAAVPIVLPIAFFPPRYNMRQESDEDDYVPIHKATLMLFKNVKYLLIVLGYAMYCFVVGAVSVWAIPMLVEGPLRLSNLTGSIIMGGVTALTGVFGSLAGGIALDKMGGSYGDLGAMKCQMFNTGMIVLCIPLGITAIFMTKLWFFIPALVASVFALFAVTAPLNASILTVVPVELRAYAINYSVLLIHLFGDFPSPTFVGYLSDHVFSKGCPQLNETMCNEDKANQCYWVTNENEDTKGHCTNEYQLRNALFVVFLILIVAIPSWIAVYFLLKKSQRRIMCTSSVSEVSLVNQDHEQNEK